LNTRKCEVLIEGRWSVLPFEDMKAGHVYRLFEPDGEPESGGQICLALSDAYLNDLGIWTVKTEPMGMVINVLSPKFEKIICVDFDGVIHDHGGGWQDVVAGGPVEGAFEWLNRLLDDSGFKPVIYSSRSDEEAGVEAMRAWFVEHGFTRIDELEFPTQKPPAWLTVEDRCFLFDGVFPSLRLMAESRPWNR